MPKTWSEISQEEVINYEEAHTGQVARYGRIMQKHATDATKGLTDTIYKASQSVQDKADDLSKLYENGAQQQRRQQNVVIALTCVIAVATCVYTWITWKSVKAMQDANYIQRELLNRSK